MPGLNKRTCGQAAAAAAAAALALAWPSVATGLINPDFTPADLVRGAKVVLLLRVSAPEKLRVQGRLVEALKGEAPAGGQIVLDLARAESIDPAEVAAAFAGAKTATAVLIARKDAATGKLAGGVQIDTAWFGVREGDRKGTWRVDRDSEALELVWAGSARMLARGARYVLQDPTAAFPVASALRWGGDRELGRLGGRANGCVVAHLGDGAGLCAVFLSDGGDRVYQAAGGRDAPPDITARLKLATTSRRIAPGDYDADGRLDLASWDGRRLRIAMRRADGTFRAPSDGVELADCRSLAAIEVGPKGRPGLLAGTGRGAVLFASDASGGMTRLEALPPQPQGPASRLGPAGPCVVADLDGDGCCDVLQVRTKGVALFAGAAEPGRFAPPSVTALDLPSGPRQAVCGDYDADGRLDVIVVGDGGVALLSRGTDGRWADRAGETGELVRHGGGGQGPVAAAPCDINADGRQSVVLLYPRGNPAVFFSRGFACFGLARKLVLAESKLKGAAALGRGQSAGAMIDLNGDGAQDLIAAAPTGAVWALLGETDEAQRLGVTVMPPARAAGPVTVTVGGKGRCEGMYVVRPGMPAFIGRARRGPVDLTWRTRDGRTHTRRVVVLRPTQVTLAVPEAEAAVPR